MKNVVDATINSVLSEGPDKLEETWRKSIAAQVFLNYFIAIHHHIQHTGSDRLQQLPYFQSFQAKLNEEDITAIEKLLKSCWSTEYALRATAQFGDDDYLRYALHWSFPQAYYSALAGYRAFLCLHNINTINAGVISREVGRLVIRNAYPKTIDYYASGPYPDFTVRRLPLVHSKPGLQLPEQEMDNQAQIGQFLRTTRKLKALSVRNQLQRNSQTALRSAKTGKILEKWTKPHWQQITWRLGYTTLFDLLGRLQISASNKEIERFVEADIDFRLFHESLLEIVSYLNGIHEAYVTKALGLENYQAMINRLPAHLKEGFVAARLCETITPLLGTGPDYPASTSV